MVLRGPAQPLKLEERPDPEPAAGEVRLRVDACADCRTDLHIVDGELGPLRWPIVPGHEMVGIVDRLGAGVSGLQADQRVGVPWLGHSCGHCAYCRCGRENLCDTPVFTSPPGVYDLHGNAAAHMNLPLAESQMASRGSRELGVTEMKGGGFIFDTYRAHEDWCRWRAPCWHGSRILDVHSHANDHLGFRCCKTLP